MEVGEARLNTGLKKGWTPMMRVGGHQLHAAPAAQVARRSGAGYGDGGLGQCREEAEASQSRRAGSSTGHTANNRDAPPHRRAIGIMAASTSVGTSGGGARHGSRAEREEVLRFPPPGAFVAAMDAEGMLDRLWRSNLPRWHAGHTQSTVRHVTAGAEESHLAQSRTSAGTEAEARRALRRAAGSGAQVRDMSSRRERRTVTKGVGGGRYEVECAARGKGTSGDGWAVGRAGEQQEREETRAEIAGKRDTRATAVAAVRLRLATVAADRHRRPQQDVRSSEDCDAARTRSEHTDHMHGGTKWEGDGPGRRIIAEFLRTRRMGRESGKDLSTRTVSNTRGRRGGGHLVIPHALSIEGPGARRGRVERFTVTGRLTGA
ncbi:hypothetical protein DFH09DRAFT_1077059 [Mycena vulgaris]|nr:hypothetical protein DFH09DRAFT_1077059 [Mycena vulgaris]